MKKTLLLLAVILSAAAASTAQSRFIARGAEEGELYQSIIWYLDYYKCIYDAILHITENGKKLEISYSVEYRSPDAGIADSLPMQTGTIIADATPGVLYNADWYMAYFDGQPYDYTRLWFSGDYGKTWELRDDNMGGKYYYVANNEGIIYRGGEGIYKSMNYAQNFSKVDSLTRTGGEPGLIDCEFYKIIDKKLQYTEDCYISYEGIKIDSQFIFGQVGGCFPDVFRGGLPGEVYVTSMFPDGSGRVSFSADTGYHFRVVHHRKNYAYFMSDRKAGDFYIISAETTETQQPWGWYTVLCIEHYTNYGETRSGTYCHQLTRNYPERCAGGVMDMEAKIQDGNSAALQWNPPQSEQPVIAYRIYRNSALLKELQQTVFIDADLPDGSYAYHVRAVYADSCESLSYNRVALTVQVTGIEGSDTNSTIKIYPNPTTNQLKIENGEWRIENVEIFDIVGRKLSTFNSQLSTVDVSHLPSGMYFVRITTEKGVITKKVVKN